MTQHNGSDRQRQHAYDETARTLVMDRSTLVLATAGASGPWSAPVYFVYHSGGFYFFSSADARHVRQALRSGQCSGSIFEESDQWEAIKGLQMRGAIQQVKNLREQLGATGAYLKKFPFAARFIKKNGSPAGQHMPRAAVHLYRFEISGAWCTSNRLGFGEQIVVSLP